VKKLVAVACALALAGCSKKQPVWTGWVMPTTDGNFRLKVGQFESLEACRSKVSQATERNDVYGGNRIMCGLNCRFTIESAKSECERVEMFIVEKRDNSTAEEGAAVAA